MSAVASPRAFGIIVALAAAALLLAGCAATSYSALDEPFGDDDELPAFVTDPGIEPGSQRFVTERDGTRYYLARAAEFEGRCLVVVPENEDGWIAGCGGGDPTLSRLGTAWKVVPDSFPTPEGAERISPNVLLLGD